MPVRGNHPVQDRVLAFVAAAGRPVTTDEVRRYLKTYLQVAQRVLAELERKGHVTKVVVGARAAPEWAGRDPGRLTGRRALWSAPIQAADPLANVSEVG